MFDEESMKIFTLGVIGPHLSFRHIFPATERKDFNVGHCRQRQEL